MKSFLQPFSPSADSRRAVVSFGFKGAFHSFALVNLAKMSITRGGGGGVGRGGGRARNLSENTSCCTF